MKIVGTNLSRVLTHLTDETSCAIISAYRSENSLDKNKALFRQLKDEVRSLGYGYIEFVSRWVEDGEASDEESILIPDIGLREALNLGTSYNQASIIYKDELGAREICTNDFETYVPGDVVRKFDTKNFNIKTAEDIFAKRKGGPASKLKKGDKRAFNLQVVEKIEARPSVFRGPSYTTIFESDLSD